MLVNHEIICLASAPWSSPARVNCHQIMARLAGRNRVLFVDTIGGRAMGRRDVRKAAQRLRQMLGGLHTVDLGLTVLSPLVVPMHRVAAVRAVNRWALGWQVGRAAGKLQLLHPIAWVFNPLMAPILEDLKPSLVIYHCVDNYAANARTDARTFEEAERAILRRADLVFATSRPLFNRLRAQHEHVVLAENVADTTHFRQALNPQVVVPSDLRIVTGPIIGFIGNLSNQKIDFGLLRAIAGRQPTWSFVLIGPAAIGDPDTDLSCLRKLPNIHLFGPRPYRDLPGYLRGIDVCLIPFRQNQLTAGSLPMKFFEYLAAGRPIVGTPLPSLAEYGSLFYEASTADEVIAGVKRALAEGSSGELAQLRSQQAEAHNWSARLAYIEAEIERQLTAGAPSPLEPNVHE